VDLVVSLINEIYLQKENNLLRLTARALFIQYLTEPLSYYLYKTSSFECPLHLLHSYIRISIKNTWKKRVDVCSEWIWI